MKECDIEKVQRLFKYDPETGVIERWFRDAKVWKRVGTVVPSGYSTLKINGTNYRAHRVAWALYYQEWPDLQIDHINGDRSDNRIANLRKVTIGENSQNRHRKTQRSQSDIRSQYIGVSFNKASRKWFAKIVSGGIQRGLGYFNTEEEAYAARCAAMLKYFTHSPLHTSLAESPMESVPSCTASRSTSTELALCCAPNLFNLPEYVHDHSNRN